MRSSIRLIAFAAIVLAAGSAIFWRHGPGPEATMPTAPPAATASFSGSPPASDAPTARGDDVDSPAVVDGPALPAPDQDALRHLRDTTTPLPDRLHAVRDLGQRSAQGDAPAATALLRIGAEPGPLVTPAHQALTRVAVDLRPAICVALRPRLAHPEAAVVMAATELLGRIGGVEAIPPIDALLATNWQRPDGFGQLVCEAGARALAHIGDARAVPTLTRELRCIAASRMQCELDYGDAVVEALRSTGSPTAIAPLRRYAEALRAARPASGPRRAAIDTHLHLVEEALNALTPQ